MRRPSEVATDIAVNGQPEGALESIACARNRRVRRRYGHIVPWPMTWSVISREPVAARPSDSRL